MRVLLKIAICIISVSMVVPFHEDEFYYCSILSLLLFIMTFCDLLSSVRTFINGEFSIDEPNNKRKSLTYDDMDYLGYYNYDNVPSEHHRYMPQNNTIVYSSSNTITHSLSESELIDKINERVKTKNKFEVVSQIDVPKKEASMFKTIKSLFVKKEEKKEDVVNETKVEVKPNTNNIVEINKNVDGLKKTIEERKTSSNKSYIILKNENGMTKEKSQVYDEIVKVLKNKKYPTSKICRMLQAMQHINVLTSNVIIYTNERCLDMTDLMPKKDIIEHIKEKLNMKVTFINMKTVSVLDYYLKVGST